MTGAGRTTGSHAFSHLQVELVNQWQSVKGAIAWYSGLIPTESKGMSNILMPPYKSCVKCLLWPMQGRTMQRRKCGAMYFYFSQVNLMQCHHATKQVSASMQPQAVNRCMKRERHGSQNLQQNPLCPQLFLP